ncbi:flagellar hook-length control protein FliK [Pseudomonas mucidolens]|uniref:flagellar hook-length control protein FliK n=1 Tax=Pseudomonas mucidolens TaxID=46679 RepID=UPI0030D7E964
MPLAPNSLLQAAPAAKPQASSATAPAMAVNTRTKAPGFAQVFAKEAQVAPAKSTDMTPKPSRDKSADPSARKDVGNDKPAAATPAVADSGKTLPAKPADKSDAVSSKEDDSASDTTLVQQSPADPVVDPALVAAVTPAQAVEEVAKPVAVTAAPVVAEEVKPFDPEADPLDALPAVRLAMEQGGHVSAASQAAQKTAPAPLPTQAEPTAAQSFTNGLAAMVDQQAAKDSTDQGGDNAFSGLIDDGLKDLKNASSDTRVDDFANRLAALTQAAPKTANALPINQQPLAMHQSGWTEEVVNRVMYLSSANLKSAEIQLQPAELGRLDIRVNMTADQQAQVSFMSGHAVVREALESQSGRLREMFAQQGMGQVDVNVSDQSRGWQGQGQEQQQHQARGVGAGGGRADGMDAGIAGDAPDTVAPIVSSVIGSSAVDYYA